MAVARSSSGGVAICYVFPVLWKPVPIPGRSDDVFDALFVLGNGKLSFEIKNVSVKCSCFPWEFFSKKITGEV